ncbi:hypothetical protein EAI_17551 [Harpegnathos saltator]|uniref:Uncharacterized protein n=1 Tax=Harpegnathos saltator TaxID=610380 RepID=E2BFF9_HARSA|nr:hypothetical protein EAI_17551 [Harpegnathos saltator]
MSLWSPCPKVLRHPTQRTTRKQQVHVLPITSPTHGLRVKETASRRVSETRRDDKGSRWREKREKKSVLWPYRYQCTISEVIGPEHRLLHNA